MNYTLQIKSIQSRPIFYMILSALISSLFLFYIDEGYYSFAWMKQRGAWFVFGLFVCILTSVQFVLAYPFQKLLNKRKAFIASIAIALLPLCLLAFLAVQLFA